MGKKPPLGKRESQALELKAADALKRPFTISKEVVGMLNAGGGKIWIGLREDHGIAVEAQDIPDVERAKADLFDHLVEVIEPRLVPGDVRIDVVEHEARKLLLVSVSGEARRRGPFAQLEQGGRRFSIRVDHRLRPMTLEEIRAALRVDRGAEPPLRLPELRDSYTGQQRSGLWIGIEPVPSSKLEVQDPAVERLLLEPEHSQNRSPGWNFGYLWVTGIRPRLRPACIELGQEDSRKTRIHQDGCVEFSATLDRLRNRTDLEPEIYPKALLEYAVSIARLATTLYREVAANPPEEVFLDVALTGAEGWHLPPYAPGTYGYQFQHADPELLETGSFLLPSPLRFSWQEVDEHPDHAGYMLVRSIYQAFGLREDRIPEEYDRVRKELILHD